MGALGSLAFFVFLTGFSTAVLAAVLLLSDLGAMSTDLWKMYVCTCSEQE